MAKVRWKIDLADKIIKAHGLEPGGAVEQAVCKRALELAGDYVPKQTGQLLASGHVVRGGIVWDAPYAREVYYRAGSHTADGLRGPYWFARMKADRMGEICEAAAKAAGGKRA